MIRLAEARDAGQIAALWSEMILHTTSTFTAEPKTERAIGAMISERKGAVFVLELKGHFSGFVTFGSFRQGPGYAATVEHTIVVAADAQGAGHGRALIQRAEAAAREAGHHVMVAGISGTNDAGVRFHARMGFAEVGRMPQVGRKWGQWLDLVLMQKIL